MNLLTLLAQAQAPVDNGGGAGFLLGGGMILVGVIIFLAVLIFWLWALIDAIRNPALTDTERIIWVIVMLVTGVLGSLVYLVIGRKGGVARSAT